MYFREKFSVLYGLFLFFLLVLVALYSWEPSSTTRGVVFRTGAQPSLRQAGILQF